MKLAEESLTTAEIRYRFLSGIRLDEQAGELESRDIKSPVTGVLQGIDAAAGETVAAGDALFTVITTNRMWIRVPVYVGQWRDIDTTQAATIAEFGHSPGKAPRKATYVSAPPTADPNASTIDIYYELSNDDAKLYPGQKLAATVPLKSRANSLVVPFKAILYDIHGGAWVYEHLAVRVCAATRIG